MLLNLLIIHTFVKLGLILSNLLYFLHLFVYFLLFFLLHHFLNYLFGDLFAICLLEVLFSHFHVLFELSLHFFFSFFLFWFLLLRFVSFRVLLLVVLHSFEQFGLVIELNKRLDKVFLFISGCNTWQRLGLHMESVFIDLHILVNLHFHVVLRQIWELEILIITISLSEGISLAGE